jgi:hypothetical protein
MVSCIAFLGTDNTSIHVKDADFMTFSHGALPLFYKVEIDVANPPNGDFLPVDGMHRGRTKNSTSYNIYPRVVTKSLLLDTE